MRIFGKYACFKAANVHLTKSSVKTEGGGGGGGGGRGEVLVRVSCVQDPSQVRHRDAHNAVSQLFLFALIRSPT